ncbi:hypothetical protein [Cytobacillus horneckiae]|uniref:hypothetical protein n=1 Tax=Cytobacillus horneckiae TaxID=549687 RepID=UPI003D2618C2
MVYIKEFIHEVLVKQFKEVHFLKEYFGGFYFAVDIGNSNLWVMAFHIHQDNKFDYHVKFSGHRNPEVEKKVMAKVKKFNKIGTFSA